jgi:hypothetical protein
MVSPAAGPVANADTTTRTDLCVVSSRSGTLPDFECQQSGPAIAMATSEDYAATMRFVLVAGLAALLVGCTAPGSSPSASAPANPSAAASAAAQLQDCSPIELRTPQGVFVDLTGAWTGGSTIHDVRQLGDCVWWVGRSDWPNEELGSLWALVFSGHLHPDFTLSGEWVEVYRTSAAGGGGHRGLVAFDIEVQVVDGQEVIVLHRDNTAQLGDQGNFYTADTLTRIQ